MDGKLRRGGDSESFPQGKQRKRKSCQNSRKKVKWVEIRGNKKEIENKNAAFVTGARNQKYCC